MHRALITTRLMTPALPEGWPPLATGEAIPSGRAPCDQNCQDCPEWADCWADPIIP